MRNMSLHRRRPSAATAISLIALFVSLGGVGYAAVSVPDNSVGTAQLRHSSVTHSKLRFNSVSYQDIQPAAVGRVRANLNQLQARVGTTCAPGGAIGSIDSAGKVNCNPARPAEFGTTATVTVPAALTSVADLNLPSGSSYLALANPSASVPASAPAPAQVTCSLTLGANKQTRTATVRAGETESIPLQVAGPAGPANVSCQSTGAPSSVTAAINAVETSANN